MGNQNCCSTRSKDLNNTLNKHDLIMLTDLFKHYSSQNPEYTPLPLFIRTNPSMKLNSAIFQKVLPDLPHLGQMIYKYCAF